VKQTSERVKEATRERRRRKECDELDENKKSSQERIAAAIQNLTVELNLETTSRRKECPMWIYSSRTKTY
jgi:hypothetical protein